MSSNAADKALKRPRRIIAGDPVAAPVPMRGQSERFQRALQQVRRGDAGRADSGRAEMGRVEGRRGEVRGGDVRGGDLRRNDSATGGAGSGVVALADPRLAPPSPADDAPPLAPTPPKLPPEASVPASTPPRVEPERAVAMAETSSNPGWSQELVRKISTLCCGADPAFVAWSLVLPLDARVLPDSELHLSFSPHRLLLRFYARSAVSLHLVSSHQQVLIEMLRQALPAPREIEIEVT